MKKAYSYIRFSTPEQRKGHSFKRQTEMAAEWALENGYELADSIEGFKLLDDGVPSFNGENIKTGALGAFYRAIDAGKIEPGSALVVESLDRLSREGAMAFLPRFIDIINAGIILVTLIDGERRYEKGKINDIDLIVTIIGLTRAHEESATKSYRSWLNHVAKRNITKENDELGIAKDKFLVGDGMVPAWIRILKSEEKKRGPWPVELIPERADLIRWMVDQYLDGQGETHIAKKLNSQRVRTWRIYRSDRKTDKQNPDMWTKNYIWRILRNRQLIGEHQLYYFPHDDIVGEKKHRVISRKPKDRIPDGDPIKHYFPPVLDEGIFALLQKKIALQAGPKGRKGNVESMFPSIARCAYCGSAMIFINKGYKLLKNKTKIPLPKYLVCWGHRNGIIPLCVDHYIQYAPIKEAFLKWCREVDLSSLTNRNDHREQLGKLEKDLAETNGALDQLKAEIRGLELQARGLKNERAASQNAQSINSAYDTLEGYEKRKAKIEDDIVTLESSDRTVKDHLEALSALNDRLDKTTNHDELVGLRLQLRSAIAAAVSEIRVFHDGLRNLAPDWTDQGVELREYFPERNIGSRYIAKISGDVEAIKEAEFDHNVALSNYRRLNTGRENAAFLVSLKNGSQRLFQWDELNKVYKERIVFEKDKERIVDGGVTIDLRPASEWTEEEIAKEISFLKNLQ